jgi:hypothetical protein
MQSYNELVELARIFLKQARDAKTPSVSDELRYLANGQWKSSRHRRRVGRSVAMHFPTTAAPAFGITLRQPDIRHA